MGNKRKHQAAPFRSPDAGFDRAQYPWLNTQFYEGFNVDLLHTRLAMLCLMHDSPSLLRDRLGAGVTWGKLRFALDPNDMTDAMLRQQAEIELVALRQHAAEVLFRVFWVHALQDPCPWLALGRIRSPGDLKRLVEQYQSASEWTDKQSRLAFHSRSAWGSGSVAENGAVREELAAPAGNVADWVACAAAQVHEAPLYNAYKHGLAIFSHEPFSIGFGAADDEGPEIKIEAPSGFKYLDRMTNEAERRHYWALVNEPVDFDEAACQTTVYGLILEGVLIAGALDRRVMEKPPRELLVLNSELTPDSVRTKSASPYRLQRFCDSMAYFK